VDTQYALKVQLANRDSLLAVYDMGRDANNIAWIRTPVFTVDRDTRADILMTINADTTDANQNETAYFLNGASFTPALATPPADGAPGAASNSEPEYFAHAGAIYRNVRIAARFAVDRLGQTMPLVPVRAFVPGTWSEPRTNVVNGATEVSSSYQPATHFESPPNPVQLVISDVASAYNEPFVGISATNPVGFLRYKLVTPPGGPTSTNTVLRGRNRPDNREFHEYGHAIMFASSITGLNHLPELRWEDTNYDYNLDPGEDKNSNGRLDRLRNHDGLANSDSSDSWAEGWAEFISAVISDVMLERREKLDPRQYISQSTTKNLDDLYSYNSARNDLRSEEYIFAALLWDLYDPTNASESERLQLPLDTLWDILTASGPRLEKFHDVTATFIE